MTRLIWEPLRQPLFRALWLAALASNVGTWMHDIGAAWLMTSLTQSPLMVALLQTAIFLPFFLMAVPAGALADVFDRRILLLTGHVWMLLAALCLAVFSFFGYTTPWLLLTFTFALGLGAAISAPAWNAITPELVSRHQLQNAIALNSVSFNIARGIGAVIGGLVVNLFGSGAVFLLNALSFLGLITFFSRWQQTKIENFQHGERVLEAIKAGIRYVCHASALRAVLFRSLIFTSSASAFWALLPLVLRQKLGASAIQYGLAIGLFGIGTLIGAFILPKIRKHFTLDSASAFGTLCLSTSIIGLAFSPSFLAASPYMLAAGASWLLVNACLNLAVQLVAPQWVRARALAFYILVCQGGIAFGAMLWGKLASGTDLTMPLVTSSLVLAFSLLAIRRFPLVEAEKLDVTQSKHWDMPELVFEPAPDHGPVLVTVEYLIGHSKANEFKEAMNTVRRQRLRDGAFQWHLFHDLATPGRFVETYFVESWAEHMRQHERVTVADRQDEERATSFHTNKEPPIVAHYISAYAEKANPHDQADAFFNTPVPEPAEYRYLLKM